jgi:hypothetical protein
MGEGQREFFHYINFFIWKACRCITCLKIRIIIKQFQSINI